MTFTADPIATLESTLAPLKDQLLKHPLYHAVRTPDDLRYFMSQHVFAVWDFMSLLKRLQAEIAGTSLPWIPSTSPDVVRFVNEIVLGEESDVDPEGQAFSHFDLYRNAMLNLNADTKPIDELLREIHTNVQWATALERCSINNQTATFVLHNLTVATSGTTAEVAAAFCYGREDIIPEMFERLIPAIEVEGEDVSALRYYLDRHIELDGDTHGPLARSMVRELCGDDERKWNAAETAASDAIRMRLRLWDGILSHLPSRCDQASGAKVVSNQS